MSTESKSLPCFIKLFALSAITFTSIGLVGCDSDSDDNSAPTVSAGNLTLQAGTSKPFSVLAEDADGDRLSYRISAPPQHGTAVIDEDGKLTYNADNYIGTDQVVISVSDGNSEVDMTMNITVQAEPAFDYQFYRVTNPDTSNSQIVRYDPNDQNANTNQIVVKDNVILGNKVFVMSGAVDGDKIQYIKREYAVFLDPSASSEQRMTNAEPPVEYTFYTDNVLKRFDAESTAAEAVIFQSSQMPQSWKDKGLKVIDDVFSLHTVETDIDNSYVQLKAFERLPDLFRAESGEDILHMPITVRISSSKAVAGRLLSTIVNGNGRVQSVLISEVDAHTEATGSSVNKQLKLCDALLDSCENVAGGTGNFYHLANNSETIYLAKSGSDTIFAFDKGSKQLSEVSGVKYPAAFDSHHHLISYNGGHGGAGIFTNFYNMPGAITTLSEGDVAYLLVNYNLDTNDPVGEGRYTEFGFSPYVHKNAMVLKLTGTKGSKIYDNGTGVDLKNESDGLPVSYNMSLAAVKDGKLFVEASRFNGSELKTFHYVQGWLDTTSGENKTEFDKRVIDQDIAYFTAIRVPPLAVGDYLYVNESIGASSSQRVYNIYKLPINDMNLSKDDASVQHVTGRMYFERDAYRTNGIYEGNVLLWDRHNNGQVLNATTGQVMGSATGDINENITNVRATSTGNGTLAGIGGLFGLHMTTGHGETPFLVSGEASEAQSLKSVNQISGSWITD